MILTPRFCVLLLMLGSMAPMLRSQPLCYTTCSMQGCSPNNATVCTSCDNGLVLLSSTCISAGTQPVHIKLFLVSSGVFDSWLYCFGCAKSSRILSKASGTMLVSEHSKLNRNLLKRDNNSEFGLHNQITLNSNSLIVHLPKHKIQCNFIQPRQFTIPPSPPHQRWSEAVQPANQC